MTTKERIAEIIRQNDAEKASEVIAEIMRELAEGESWVVIGFDSADEFIQQEIDKVCWKTFG